MKKSNINEDSRFVLYTSMTTMFLVLTMVSSLGIFLTITDELINLKGYLFQVEIEWSVVVSIIALVFALTIALFILCNVMWKIVNSIKQRFMNLKG